MDARSGGAHGSAQTDLTSPPGHVLPEHAGQPEGDHGDQEQRDRAADDDRTEARAKAAVAHLVHVPDLEDHLRSNGLEAGDELLFEISSRSGTYAHEDVAAQTPVLAI